MTIHLPFLPSLIVFPPTFRSLIHLETIIEYGEMRVQFILSHKAALLSQDRSCVR